MRDKKDRTLYVVLVIMGLIAVISLSFAGITGYMYINEREELQNTQKALEKSKEEVVPVFADDKGISEEELQVLLAEKEESVTVSIKDKMKELVSSKDGGPLTTIRYFFPENLVFYDEGAYVFEPILDSIKRHNLKAENFRKNDLGEMEYVENGVVVSHKGIDVSKYQGKIDWEAVKSDGVEFAIIRLGLRGYESGKLAIDDYYKENMRGANNAGVKAGVYFFTEAITVEEAIEEAEYVIEQLEDYDVPYPVVFDVELISNGKARADKLSKEDRTDITIAFCDRIREAGYVPMIYGNVKCFTRLLDMTRLENIEKWYAFYDNYMYFPYEVSMWQYTEKGKVKGIKGNVDVNIAYKEW